MTPKTALQPGKPQPLGASWDGYGVNFALFSENAEKVELCLFDESGERELERIRMPEYTDQVWHGYHAGVRPGLLYGYRVYGPYDPGRGHRFNPHKLLVDPYAKALHGALKPDADSFGYRVGDSRGDLSFDRRDSAPYVPKCRVVAPGEKRGDHNRPGLPWPRTTLYELHVRGFTMRHPDVPKARRGTFSGLCEPPVIDHIAKLGVTAVELLPVHPIAEGWTLVRNGLTNYWGYNTYNYFALEPRYLADGDPGEFSAMVRCFHEAGIEVILDVVYNHTGEGSHLGPTLSFRGIDNASYYRLAEDGRHYIDHTGCGNTLNLAHPRVLQMVMDSLRYWAEEMHVDGFRFDLATTLAREGDAFDPGSGFFDTMRQDPVLSRLKLIAEPWDLGPEGYRLGGFPPGWAEWNDRYRNAVRRWWKGDDGLIGEFASRLTGSSDLFDRAGRRPWASINYVTAHDGFTLNDLVSYDRKHNEDNLEDNADGASEDDSWNCGVEGPTDDADVRALREQQKRNIMATLLLSLGVPMLLAGDEMGRTQSGNNNAYCQDNEVSWLDWENWSSEDVQFLEFVRRLLRIRRDHPVFRRPRFFHGRTLRGMLLKDITWLGPDGGEISEADWSDGSAHSLGIHFPDAPLEDRSGARRPGSDVHFLLLFNSSAEPLSFKLPPPTLGGPWQLLLDTARSGAEETEVDFRSGEAYPLLGRSLALLQTTPTQRASATGRR